MYKMGNIKANRGVSAYSRKWPATKPSTTPPVDPRHKIVHNVPRILQTKRRKTK